MRWSLILVVALLAAACTSSASHEAEQAAELPVSQDGTAPEQPAFALLPADGSGVARVRQRTVFVETVLVVGDQDMKVLFIGGPQGSLVDDPCAGEYEIDVAESTDQIVLTVHELALVDSDANQRCTFEGHQRAMTITLGAPIADRPVVDGRDNGPRVALDPAAFLWPNKLPAGWVAGSRDASRAFMISRYGEESNTNDSIVLLAGPIDGTTWSMAEATSDPAAEVVPAEVRTPVEGPAVMIRSVLGQTTIAFDERGMHYRATAIGAVTEEMLSTFVADLARDADARGLEIPYFIVSTSSDEGSIPIPTVTETDPTIAWSAAESTRDVVNYLEALRAGAYEEAAWPAWGNGVLLDGQTADETGADFLSRSCAGGLCSGPYLVRGQPGVVDPETMRASAVVVVTHLASGLQSRMPVLTFEGQRIIGNLPPLVADSNDASLRESLFGPAPPDYVVVERFKAFEVWDGDETTWLTNWFSGATSQIEGDVLVGAAGTFSVTDPQQEFGSSCLRLLERDGAVLSLDQCEADEWVLREVATGESVDAPFEYQSADEAEQPWFAERGGTVLAGVRDPEGNLASLVSSADIDLLNGDSAGASVISVDGTHVAYVDHNDPDARSNLWSPVVVVREVSTGTEVGRWTLNGAVICLEFAVRWVVACEADDSTLGSATVDQRSLVAIDITTGVTNPVPTATKLFLPVQVEP